MVGTLRSSQRVELLTDVPYAAYAPPGMIVFFRDSRLMAQRFDAARLRLEGEAQPVEPQLQPETVVVSDTGTLTYLARLAGPVRRNGEITAGNARLAWLDRAGRLVEALTPPGGYFNPRMSRTSSLLPSSSSTTRTRAILNRPAAQARHAPDVRRATRPDPVWAPRGDRLAWTRGGDVGGGRCWCSARGGRTPSCWRARTVTTRSVRRGLVARRPRDRRHEGQPNRRLGGPRVPAGGRR